MENKVKLYKKLAFMQASLKGVSKDKKSYTYSYVSGDKLLPLIKDLMISQNLLLKQEVIEHTNVRQDYEDKNKIVKNEILTTLVMRFTWVDCDTGETDINLWVANGQNGWDKGVGSALTYGERYFLLKYFHISTDKDDIDNPLNKEEEKPVINTDSYVHSLMSCATGDELIMAWSALPVAIKRMPTVEMVKDKLKIILCNPISK